MFSDLGKTRWVPQIDINAVEAQAAGITLVFAVLLCTVGCGFFKERFGSNSFQHRSVWVIKLNGRFQLKQVSVHQEIKAFLSFISGPVQFICIFDQFVNEFDLESDLYQCVAVKRHHALCRNVCRHAHIHMNMDHANLPLPFTTNVGHQSGRVRSP